VTFYDDASGERTELSVTTYANWVAKTASLLADELDLERGDSLRVDLPTHWLGPVVLGAAWTVGLRVTWDDAPDAVVCGPDGIARWQERAGDIPVVASALHPLATRFAEPLPTGVVDLGVEVWSQPDAFVALDPPTGGDAATDDAPHAELWDAAADGSVLRDGDRVLSEENPASPSGLPSFTEPLVRGGSLVLVTHADPERLEATYAAERATARFPWS
jgi:uncharacterized protein (TIGR03089 family)